MDLKGMRNITDNLMLNSPSVVWVYEEEEKKYQNAKCAGPMSCCEGTVLAAAIW